jgi:4a-hydroxytetrahydrobiopterin dehydratase
MNKLSREPLDEQVIQSAIMELPGWSYAGSKLFKTFQFNNFREAMTFMVRLAFEAEQLDHHPEIKNVYNKVGLALNTHDAGGRVTALDIDLARRIEKIQRTQG